MANLRDIRNRIASVNSTQQITNAMKMVAAAKLRRAQDRIIETRPYASKIQEVVGRLAESSGVESAVMDVSETNDNILIVVIGSDRGLCGGFNHNLFKEVDHFLSTKLSAQVQAGTVSLAAIGKKAIAHYSKQNFTIVKDFPGFFDNPDFEVISKLMGETIEEFVSKKYDEVYVAYNEFKSVISQVRKIEKVLPVNPEHLTSLETSEPAGAAKEYIYEPDSDEILNKLLPLHLNMQLWKAVLESNASEQGARMTAMDSATENAKELERSLKLKYNQARQSAITTEISEIVSGAQALSGG